MADRSWPGLQKVVRVASGVHFHFNLKINDELARWVLSLGVCAEVRAPQNLIDSVAKLSQEIADFYKSKKAA